MTTGNTVALHRLLEGPEDAPESVTQASLDHMSPVLREER